MHLFRCFGFLPRVGSRYSFPSAIDRLLPVVGFAVVDPGLGTIGFVINTDDDHLMFIEPTSKTAEEAIYDDFTELAVAVLEQASPGKDGERWRGVHTCACGVRSDNIPWRIDGVLTNSLLPHYVREHRSEVPPEELEKLQTVAFRFMMKTESGMSSKG